MRSDGGEVVTTGRLKDRTRGFALSVIRIVEAFPRDRCGRVIGDQLFRAGTSVAANYRAAARARSRREFIAKLGIVEEEGDESLFWLELAVDCSLVNRDQVLSLLKEGNQILAMVVSSIRTARQAKGVTPHSTLRTARSQCS
jgi:four helix bundle protein